MIACKSASVKAFARFLPMIGSAQMRLFIAVRAGGLLQAVKSELVHALDPAHLYLLTIIKK